MGNSTENGDYPQDQDNCIETESNCSMEDAVAKLEHALRRNFKSNDEDTESLEMIEEGTWFHFLSRESNTFSKKFKTSLGWSWNSGDSWHWTSHNVKRLCIQ